MSNWLICVMAVLRSGWLTPAGSGMAPFSLYIAVDACAELARSSLPNNGGDDAHACSLSNVREVAKTWRSVFASSLEASTRLALR